MFTSSGKVFIALTALLLACGPQQNNETNQADNAQGNTAEIEVGQDVAMESGEDFLISANMNSQLQIALSKAALLNSNAPKVKELSQSIIAENKEIQSNIMALSEAAGIEMAPALSPEYVSLLDSIQSYSGEKFDSAFVVTIIDEHEDDIERFEDLAAETDNPITREQVTQNMEILERHLQAAKEIQTAMEDKK